ncbi:fimbrial biogenesis outer membrane usher protein [Yersinia ruckeri]|uniref:fimbria/pilus outer membrane usher protein n=1 Tax=Yersinia ruckeri TaxID=29486 RepID=UPI00119F1549|nr:fimbria/pilus outer membrane usher protein [Yersinia ruckeri]EKN3346299.1 fimbrial biogenesis outer membrane usher protein [Yersinia ruckeri]EKN3361691.1 fimbrial biogenesis outer membrane usher protein [Yersinia ruckeri]EKN4201215.1 fimbrial biogenesis outer membrane usher protein [Yersinia ruckeri]EKN4705228.1 fimbrial biogenesis outer membrane usher protein [Yersinia ruckeri]EKN4725847.1 fimbrial biogenesis outer membrane usher protein [Yersinia ruckeri]
MTHIDYWPSPAPPTRLALGLAIQLALGLTACSTPAWAEDYFNPSSLEMKDDSYAAIDLSIFAESGAQLPGIYRVDIYFNDQQIETRDVNFIEDNGNLLAEITPQQLMDLGVKVAAFPTLQQQPVDQPLTRLGDFIPAADSRFNFSKQRLDISIPQAALNNQARGYIDPKQWDQGIPALMVNYNLSGANSWQDNQPTSSSHFLSLRSGLNWGAWRLRNSSTYSQNSHGERQWNNLTNTLQRDIHAIKGQLTLGDSYTPGDILSGVPFRGVQLASDDSMLPDSLRGFAPVVRGIAESNAQITIRQNNNVIYQSYVPPGAFVINDLYPTSSSGDLEITVKEADGREHSFKQAFSAAPVMQREGSLKYAVSAGRYRSGNNSPMPHFAQTSLAYGLPYGFTLYNGLLLASDYQAGALGVGMGLGSLGSLSADVSQAKTRVADQRTQQGQSYRLQYAKSLAETGTSFSLGSHRYSTAGFYDFSEANQLSSIGSSNRLGRNNNKRSRTQVHISQSLRDFGSLYFSAYQQDYWQHKGYERNASLGYNVNLYGINYGLNYSYSQSPYQSNSDRRASLSVSIPLSKWLPNSWANYSVNTSKGNTTQQQLGLSGSALSDNSLSYSLQQSRTNHGGGTHGSLYSSYTGAYGQLNGGYSYGDRNRELNYALSGGVMAHPYGVTLSQSQGDTLVLVRAPGANDVAVGYNRGVKTDWRGYAVMPYATPYRQNSVALDTQSMGDNIDMDITSQNVVPTRGAVVLANFKPRLGNRVLINLTHQGKPVPFGAMVSLEDNETDNANSSIVGDGGQVYLSGVPDNGQLQVQWGNQEKQQCSVKFTLPAAEAENTSAVRMLDAVCR